MFKTFSAGASALLLSVLGVVLVAPQASAAPPEDCPNYTVSATATTDLSASPASPGVGDSFTATARVEVDGAPYTGGTVTFTYGGQTQTDAVSGGEATATFTAIRGTNTLTAEFSGDCLVQAIAIGSSEDSLAIVAGVQATRPGGGGDDDVAGGGANRPGAVGGASGGLGSTGFGSGTQLAGLVGAGLVVAGAAVLVTRRRLG